MAEVDTSRLAEIWCRDSRRVGTGFRVSPRHVLTARHVVGEGSGVARRVEVRLYDPLGSLPWLPARVHWENATSDLALLAVNEAAAWPEAESPPVPWGEVIEKSEIAVLAVGFPDAAKRPDERRDTWSIRGQLDPLHEARRFAEGVATVRIDKSIIPRRTQPAQPWAGASGAAVFSHATGCLLGVLAITHDIAPELNVVQVRLVAADAGLIREARTLGIAVEPIEAAAALSRRPVIVPPHLKYAPEGFVDRKEYLRRIGETLDRTGDGAQPGVAIITGMSGLGKSRLANQYARKHLDEYDVIWHIDAAKEYVDHDLNQLALGLGLRVTDVASVAEIHTMAWQELGVHRRWLLIFDDARPEYLIQGTDHEEAHSRWPACSNGHVIVTSNRTDWGDYRRSVLRLNAMSEQDALELLRVQSEREDLDPRDAADTVRALGYLPIYVEHAGRWINNGGRSAGEYLNVLRDRLTTLRESRQGGGGLDYKGAASWLTSFQDMQKRKDGGHPVGADAAELLRLLAYFAPEDIPRDLLEQHSEQATGQLRSILSDPLRTTRAIQMLVSYAFVTATPDTVSLHRLVQETTRTQLRQESALDRAFADVVTRMLEAAFPAEPADSASWDECERLSPHAQVATKYAADLDTARTESTRLLQRFGRYLLTRSSLKPAEEALQAALRLLKDPVTGDYQPGEADVLIILSSVLHTQGRLNDARQVAEEAIAIRERSGGPIGIELAHDLTMLGSACRELKDFPAALHAQQRSLGVLLVARGPDTLEVAEASDYMGRILWRMGNLHSARTAQEFALRVVARASDTASRSRAAFAHRYLGLAARDGADYVLAEQHLEESRLIFADMFGPEHRDSLKSECLLAGVLVGSGRLWRDHGERERYFARAEAHFEHVFEELPKELGTEHSDMGEARVLRSTLLRETGRLEEAGEDLAEAFRIFAGGHGEEDPYLGHVYLRRAPVRAALGEADLADADFGHALRLYRTGFGERHPYVADVYLELAGFRESQERTAEAASLRAQAASIRDYANNT